MKNERNRIITLLITLFFCISIPLLVWVKDSFRAGIDEDERVMELVDEYLANNSMRREEYSVVSQERVDEHSWTVCLMQKGNKEGTFVVSSDIFLNVSPGKSTVSVLGEDYVVDRNILREIEGIEGKSKQVEDELQQKQEIEQEDAGPDGPNP